MILELLDITEDMYVSCQERNKGEIHAQELEAALIKFMEGARNVDQ
jgi:hypothetical protein